MISIRCQDCNRPVNYGEFCEECCEHDDRHKTSCLGCGKDMTEDLFAAAYDRAKDLRKYGE